MVDGHMIFKAKELRKQGMLQTEIAYELGITQGTVSLILRREGLSGKLIKTARQDA